MSLKQATKLSERPNHDNGDIVREFHDVVNMSSRELETWLESDESKSVGQRTSDGAEATGHTSGRHIVKLLQHRSGNFSTSDYEQMRRTISFVKRHMAQRPKVEAVKDSRWAASLKNWGHDPEKAK